MSSGNRSEQEEAAGLPSRTCGSLDHSHGTAWMMHEHGIDE